MRITHLCVLVLGLFAAACGKNNDDLRQQVVDLTSANTDTVTRLTTVETQLADVAKAQADTKDASVKLQASIDALTKQLADKTALEGRLEALEKKAVPVTLGDFERLEKSVAKLAEAQAKTPDLIAKAMQDFTAAQAKAQQATARNSALDGFGKDAEAYFKALTSKPPLPAMAEDCRQRLRRSYVKLAATEGAVKLIEVVNDKVRDKTLADTLINDLAKP